MKKALLDSNGRIAQIADATFPVAPGLQWADVPDDATTRDALVGGSLVKAGQHVPTLAETLTPTDIGLIRVIEDVVESLKTGQPLPQIAVDKVNARRALRGQEPV